MLLYGPPGTGKSSSVRLLASALQWPLTVITPSNFITHGEQQVEATAKALFDVLDMQSNMVVLFDEIDRLILDRRNADYHRQGDMFQLMTPSMLTKLETLRRRGAGDLRHRHQLRISDRPSHHQARARSIGGS